MKNPPQSPKPPEIPTANSEKPAQQKDGGEEEDDDGPIPGEVVGAPA